MLKKLLLLSFLTTNVLVFAQKKPIHHFSSIGVCYGFGSEFNNRNYTFTNNFYKIQLNYQWFSTKNFEYDLVLQPEINFGTHQLLNLYFVEPHEANYEAKREAYTKLKDLHQYGLNIGFLMRKNILKNVNIFVMLSVAPMISDTDTERSPKGFTFSDVLTIGIAYKTPQLIVSVQPSIRHVSNGGLHDTNAGFNTRNIEFGVSVPFK